MSTDKNTRPVRDEDRVREAPRNLRLAPPLTEANTSVQPPSWQYPIPMVMQRQTGGPAVRRNDLADTATQLGLDNTFA